jgi:hypothetical protein
MRFRSCFLALLLLGAVVVVQPSYGGAIITNGATALGVNDQGQLNILLPAPAGFTFPSGSLGDNGEIGLARNGVGDATSPGCLCEGWGLAVTTGTGPTAGFFNQASGSGGATLSSFAAGASTATSVVTLNGAAVQVTHDFAPSAAADIFKVTVTVTNTGAEAYTGLIYRRAMDWDVNPTPFNEYVTHKGVVANLTSQPGGKIIGASNNGFASSNPLTPRGISGNCSGAIGAASVDTDFTDLGPCDQGSVFDFALGDLGVGETRTLDIYYGSAPDEASALARIGLLGLNVYSLGQNSRTGTTTGDPSTFIFGFAGVGDVIAEPEVPEPGTYAMMAAGLLGLAFLRRRR